MVNAIVLINVDRGHVNDVAQQLVALDGVTEVFSVAGRHDLVAVLRTPTNERIAELSGVFQVRPGSHVFDWAGLSGEPVMRNRN